MVSSVVNTAISGLNNASERLKQSADRVANLGGSASDDATVSTSRTARQPQGAAAGLEYMPDLAAEIVTQRIASYDFKANVKLLEVADELAEQTTDMLA